jgi:4Fe-4S ferredoxin
MVTKSVRPNELVLELGLYASTVTLTVDILQCIKCDICTKVCPKDAVTIMKTDKKLDIDISETKCVLCGVCVPFCPVNALTLRINDDKKNIIEDSHGIPRIIDKIIIDEKKCPSDCYDCEKVCTYIKIDKPKIFVELDKCIRCPKCLDVCKYDAITVNPMFEGELKIDVEKCPINCDLCISVCPTKCIEMGSDGKIVVTPRYCVYCGACVLICDKNAIDLKRSRIVHIGNGFSGSWIRALRNLTTERTVYKDIEERSRGRVINLLKKSKPLSLV